ncbi:shikimate dehydrogenase [Picrophilus oshimae]|uniref:Shikimate 5-dehydrogenase n=1 Tax=Picrophilus torridus (strain ATCC 700027 / DSM 9790 / JCM 10055 / NBRC 100828 / KAW 2/3) TaxID=1122961 RepID=Q6L1G7_PICTO|nr:shikimate dehydrogenase [Picrophilus oshimae]AAT43185.1 shikimate 5-dehydrogenase [Picrophilus oshimae DSM 9789]
MIISGLIGRPVTHSIGQLVYNRIFKDLKMDAIYMSFDIIKENLGIFCKYAAENMAGFNVTAPYKNDIIKYTNSVDSISLKTGSVNLVRVLDNRLYGYNSDYAGFIKTMDENNIELKNKRILISGTGGIARTVFNAIKDKNVNADVSFLSRSGRKPWIPENINVYNYNNVKDDYDILINCTPLGTYPDNSIAFPDNIIKKVTGIDVVYNPVRTRFLSIVESNGGRAVNGVDLFTGQGVETLKLIFNMDLDYNDFKLYVLKALSDINE